MQNLLKITFFLALLILGKVYAEENDLKMLQCIKNNTDLCINSICRYTTTSECQKECKSHARAKCDASSYDHQVEKKSDKYDKVMEIADKLNFCIQQCRDSDDRNCSNECKEKAKKAVTN